MPRLPLDVETEQMDLMRLSRSFGQLTEWATCVCVAHKFNIGYPKSCKVRVNIPSYFKIHSLNLLPVTVTVTWARSRVAGFIIRVVVGSELDAARRMGSPCARGDE